MSKKIDKERLIGIWDKLREQYDIAWAADFSKDIDDELSQNSRYYIDPSGNMVFLHEVEECINESDCHALDIPHDGFINYQITKELGKYQFLCMDHIDFFIPYYITLSETIDANYLSGLTKNSYEGRGNEFSVLITDQNARLFSDSRTFYECIESTCVQIIDLASLSYITLESDGDIMYHISSDYGEVKHNNLVLTAREVDVKKHGLAKILDRLTLSKKSGYIYLKKINTGLSDYSIAMISKGNPKLQYLNPDSCEWEDVKSQQKFNSQYELELRIQMNFGDTIYGIILVTSKEKNVCHKEVSFIKDIDMVLSDSHYVNQYSNQIRLTYGKKSSIELDMVKPIVNVKLEENNIEFMPSLTDRENWHQKRGSAECLIDRLIDPEVDEVISIDVKREEHIYIGMNMLFEPSYQIAKDVIKGEKYVNEIIRSDNSESIVNIVDKYRVRSYIAKAWNSDFLGQKRFDNMKEFIILFNLKRNYIELVKDNFRFKNKLTSKFSEKPFYINLSCKDNEHFDEIRVKAKVSNMEIGSENGIIYLNPIELSEDCHIKIWAFGNPKLQFLNTTGEWNDVSKDQVFPSNSIIRLRFLMNIDDTIYSMKFVECQ